MQLTVRHVTEYAYAQPVQFALQQLRLRPQGSAIQSVENWEIAIDGGKIETSYMDHYGNLVDLVSAVPGTQKLTITASGTVETRDSAGIYGRIYGRAPLWHFQQFTARTEPGPAIGKLSQVVASHANTLDGLHALSAVVLDAVPYEFGPTNAQTTAEQAMAIGKGVCQDHANIFISAARVAGLPARYVSGYLLMNDRIDQDATHAWAEVHLDGLGWVGFDVSNGVAPDSKYIRVAIGRDAYDAAPIYGLRGGIGDERLVVSLQVQQ